MVQALKVVDVFFFFDEWSMFQFMENKYNWWIKTKQNKKTLLKVFICKSFQEKELTTKNEQINDL